MKATKFFGSILQGVKDVDKSARSVVSSDVDIAGPISQVNKITKAFSMFVITALFTVLFVYLAGFILGTDGYLPGLVANILAGYCINSGQCNLQILLPSFAIAIIILTDLVIFLLAAVMMFGNQPEDEVADMVNEANNTLADGLENRFDDLITLLKEVKQSIEAKNE